MPLSTWYIVIAGTAFFGTIAGVCAFRRRSFVDVVLFGAIVVYLAWLWNEHMAPWGAIALSVFFGLAFLGGFVSSCRSAAG